MSVVCVLVSRHFEYCVSKKRLFSVCVRMEAKRRVKRERMICKESKLTKKKVRRKTNRQVRKQGEKKKRRKGSFV